MQELTNMFYKMIGKSKGAIEDLAQVKKHIEDNEKAGIETPNEIIPINSRTIRKETKMKKTEEEVNFAINNPIQEQISNMVKSILE